MKIEVESEASLFARDRVTGRLVFNSKAIEALGLCPAELAQRGYPLDSDLATPTESAAAQRRVQVACLSRAT
jgi:hypothetical protein